MRPFEATTKMASPYDSLFAYRQKTRTAFVFDCKLPATNTLPTLRMTGFKDNSIGNDRRK